MIKTLVETLSQYDPIVVGVLLSPLVYAFIFLLYLMRISREENEDVIQKEIMYRTTNIMEIRHQRGERQVKE